MMSPHYIPIGKLKEAFALNEHDVTPLIDALWPHEVYPFHLWANAYALFWRDAAHNNTIFYAAKSIPKCPQLNNEDYPTLIPSIYWHYLSPFYRALARHLFCEDFAKGLNYIVDLTYATIPPFLTENFDYLFSGLQRTESELNPDIPQPFTWHTNITAERFKEVLEEKAMFVASYNNSLILNLFLDSVAFNKKAAIQFLFQSGYPLQQEVKGITRALVESIMQTLPEESASNTSFVVQSRAASTGSRKDNDRIKATRQACEEIIKELFLEKQVFDNNKKHWQPKLLFDIGKTNWTTFFKALKTRLGAKPHHDTAREEWKKVPDVLKHNGRMSEQ